MSDDLLAKEKEFHKLNQKLQLKTRDVIKQIHSTVHGSVSDELYDNTNQLHSTFAMKDVKSTYPANVTSRADKQLRETLSVELDNTEIVLKKNNTLENKAILILLKGKVDMLRKELEIMQIEYDKKCIYSKELEIEKKKLEEIQMKLLGQVESLNDTVTKLENAKSDVSSKYEALSSENNALKKELDNVKKNMKVLNQQLTNSDVRLNRSLENNEKLKNALKCSQAEEKELRNQVRKLQEDNKLVVSKFKKQISELVRAFKKQMLLVDNLKKQNIYLTASEQIRLTEKDFAKLLEWKPQQL